MGQSDATAEPRGPAVLQIGEVARRTNLFIRTIRHWEEMGLLTPSARSAGGFRLYSEEDVARIRLLRFMKPLAFTLEQMRELLEIRERLASSAQSPQDREHALVWPRSGGHHEERVSSAAALEGYVAAAERRLEKLRAQVGRTTPRGGGRRHFARVTRCGSG